MSELTDRFTPTVEVRSNREFVANQGRSQLLDLPLLSTDDEFDAGQQDGNDDLVDTDLQRNRDAYSFMRLRNRQKSGPKTAEQKIISNLKLGGSLLQDMDKSVSGGDNFVISLPADQTPRFSSRPLLALSLTSIDDATSTPKGQMKMVSISLQSSSSLCKSRVPNIRDQAESPAGRRR